jgi:hypothetical protein
MKPYLVDTPDGKTITIEGPDDATDEELIAIAQKNYSANAKPVGKTKAPVDTRGTDLSLPADRTSRDLPDAGTAESLISEMKAGDASLQNAAPAAFKEINKAGSAPPAKGSINDKIAEGDLEGAWNSLTDLEKGSLVASVPVLAYGGYKIADKFLGKEKTEKPTVRVEPTGGLPDGGGGQPNNIKSRTFEAGNYGSTSMGTAPKGMSAKETQIATDIKNRYGYDFNDLKNKFGLGDVPINDVTQAEMLANTVRNQEAAAAEAPKPPVAETPVAPVQEAKPAAPIAETPKAPAAPSEVVPQGAVPPEKKKKGGRPSLESMESTTFRSDLGKGDNWLYNTAGPERRRAILAEFNDGKPAKDYETAQKLYKQYQEKYPKDMFGPVIPVEQAKARGIKPPEPYGQLGKPVTRAGVAGLALTAAEMANAAQKSSKGNDAPLRESIFNLLGMIPGLGTAFSGATYAGGLNENEAADLARRRQMPPTITKR